MSEILQPQSDVHIPAQSPGLPELKRDESFLNNSLNILSILEHYNFNPDCIKMIKNISVANSDGERFLLSEQTAFLLTRELAKISLNKEKILEDFCPQYLSARADCAKKPFTKIIGEWKVQLEDLTKENEEKIHQTLLSIEVKEFQDRFKEIITSINDEPLKGKIDRIQHALEEIKKLFPDPKGIEALSKEKKEALSIDINKKINEIEALFQNSIDQQELNELIQNVENIFNIDDFPKNSVFIDFLINKKIIWPLINKSFFKRLIKDHIEKSKDQLGNFFGVKIKEIVSIELIEKKGKLGFSIPTETHNQGRKTEKVKVKFCDTSNQPHEKIIFYKPRYATIDKAVIEYLAEFNCNGETSFPEPNDLQIINGPKEGPAYSLWKEVSGTSLPSSTHKSPVDEVGSEGNLSSDQSISSGSSIQDIKNSIYTDIANKSKVQEALLRQLKNLDRALNFISISDLHNENILIQGLKKGVCDIKKIKIIPVDLEVILKDYPTLLFGDDGWKSTRFSESEKIWAQKPTIEEMKKIENFKQKIAEENIEARILLISTQFASGLSINFDVYHRHLLAYIHSIASHKQFQPLTKDQSLELRKSLVNGGVYGDVPYFTLQKNNVYFKGVDEKLRSIATSADVEEADKNIT